MNGVLNNCPTNKPSLKMQILRSPKKPVPRLSPVVVLMAGVVFSLIMQALFVECGCKLSAGKSRISRRQTNDDQDEEESSVNKIKLQPFDILRSESSISNARVEVSPQDKVAAAGHHHGKHHAKYYEYIEVPKKGAFKMGFKRGNKKHHIERKEMQHGPHNKGYFKWHDKKGKGMHKWDYNHHDKKKKHGHYG